MRRVLCRVVAASLPSGFMQPDGILTGMGTVVHLHYWFIVHEGIVIVPACPMSALECSDMHLTTQLICSRELEKMQNLHKRAACSMPTHSPLALAPHVWTAHLGPAAGKAFVAKAQQEHRLLEPSRIMARLVLSQFIMYTYPVCRQHRTDQPFKCSGQGVWAPSQTKYSTVLFVCCITSAFLTWAYLLL